MDGNLNYEGKWWIPECTTQISGYLKIVPDKGAELHLVGSFRHPNEIFQDSGLQTDIILGELPNGKKITLYNCFIIKQHIYTPGIPTEAYFAHFVFFGYHFKKSDDIKFSEIQISYSYLDSWVNISGFDINHPLDNSGCIIKYKLPRPVQANIENYEIIIDFESEGPTWSIVQNEIYIKQRAIIRLKYPNEKSLEECINIIHLIRNFLSLGVGKPVKPLRIKGITDSNMLTISGKEYKPPIDIIYATRDSSSENNEIIPQMMVFSFKDISDKFDDCLSNWIEKAELLDPVYDLYFGTLYNPYMYLEQKFLSLVQALESYHRRIIGSSELPEIDHKNRIDLILESAPSEHKKWLKGKLEYSNEPRLRVRLMEIIERYPKIRTSKRNRDIFFNKVVKIRNHLTHYTNPDDDIIKTVLNDRKQFYNIVQDLKSLMEVCFLTELGFEENEIMNMTPYKNLIK